MGMNKNRTTRKFNQNIIALKLNSKPISGAHVHNVSAFGVCVPIYKKIFAITREKSSLILAFTN